ncbi:hypothetical protein JX265_010730 [Neoarthrinium moseri]|uniref:Uncharacterized protein n=1 Tax=Neoarthrinium moseri TaxID=1658444 RepID=A0A9P9WDT4_9PEZI|nr:hypothetical protein JX265_010730 [Neoarthrinium moseri]
MMSPKHGMQEKLRDSTSIKDEYELYSSSKAGNWLLASQLAQNQTVGKGIVHLAGSPGNYNTNIWRYTPSLLYYVLWPILRDPVNGANTYLWMAFSESITIEDSMAGRYAICDGRWHSGQRQDLILALRSVEEGGSGRAREYLYWCENNIKDFLSED